MYKIYTRLGIPPGYAYKILLMMRLTTVLLMATILQVSASTFAQQISLKEKNVPIEKIFDQIRQQSGYDFLFNRNLLKTAKPVSITVKDASLEQTLKICFSGQPFTYTLAEKTIIVKEKEPSFLESLAERWAAIDVRGVVRNEKGEALEGITVSVKGTNAGTRTNEKGEFFLNNVDEKAILVFSGVSIETYEVKVKGKESMQVNVRTKQVQLEEVAINTGYQKLSPNQVAGSYEVINNEQLNRRAGPDILSRLEGVTTAVLFDRRDQSPDQNTISPNNISVRGLSTLTETIKTPLIVVNNFPYDGDINNINPNDIESMTVLKDAAAASIWGARAGNGVIVITTKQGKFNQSTKTSLNSNLTILDEPKLFKYSRMSVSDYIGVEEFLFNNSFFDGDLGNTSNFPALTPIVEILSTRRNGTLSNEETEKMIMELKNQDVRRDFKNYIYRTAFNQQYSLSVSGGSPKIKYSLMGGIDKNLAALIGNDFDRLTLRSDNTISLIKNLDLRAGIAYTNSKSTNNSLGNIGNSNYNFTSGRVLYPYAKFADINGNPLSIVHQYRTGALDTLGGGKLLDWSFKPLQEIRTADRKSKIQDILLNLSLNYNILSGVNVEISYQYQQSNNSDNDFRSLKSYYTRNLINLYTQIRGDVVTNILPKGGILNESISELRAQNIRGQINFNRKIALNHQISLVTGGEIRERVIENSSKLTYGFDKNNYSTGNVDFVNYYPFYLPGMGSGLISNGVSFRNLTDRFVSCYGNLAYSFDERYTLSGSFRKDASNLFGVDANNKWKPLWSIGGVWNISNEDFFNIKPISYLRIRGTFGYQGNVNNSLSPYAIISMNSAGGNPLGINEPFATINQTADKNLQWESLNQTNLGIDIQLFSERISATFDIYKKKSNNLILGSPIDPTTGIETVNRNSASILNTGFEFSLNTINLKDALKWHTEFYFGFTKNKVLDYRLSDNGRTMAGSSGLSITPIKGRDPYEVVSIPFAGLDPQTGDPQFYIGTDKRRDYYSIYNQSIDTAHLIFHGSRLPRYYGSLNNLFYFKNFSLGISLSYSFKYYFLKNTIEYTNLFDFGITHSDFAKRWQKPGDEKTTNVPSMPFPSDKYRDLTYANSSANVLKGDNIRLQYIRFGYSIFSKKRLKNLFEKIEFYSVLNNLGIIWRANNEGYDPDYDRGTALFPPLRNASFGMRIEF